MTFENEREIAEAVLDGKEPFWKKCKKCGLEWSKLTPNGECPDCNPDYLEVSKPKEKEDKKNVLDDMGHTAVCDNPPEKTEGCIICRNTGHVPMVDFNGNTRSFACTCMKGWDLSQNLELQRWNGEEYQFYKFKKYRLHEFFRTGQSYGRQKGV